MKAVGKVGKDLRKIKKEIRERRKKYRYRTQGNQKRLPFVFGRHEEARDEPDFYFYQDGQEDIKKFSGEGFVLKTFIAAVLFFAVAILFKTEWSQVDSVRQFVRESYEKEFQFASVANWYESQFGRPLALIPFETNLALGELENTPELVYAVPASGTVAESFATNGTGIIVNTEPKAAVEAAKAGFVFFIGEEEEIGKAVGVQHYDGGESWYGMLENIDVKLYDHIEIGTTIGTVSFAEKEGTGMYYFALKQGETYIDPIDVISFD